MTKPKILDRIKKLLELSKSSNEHEAAMAAGRVAELMVEHQIAEADLAVANDTDEVVESIQDVKIGSDGKVVSWKRALVMGLAQSVGGSGYYVGARRAQKVHRHDGTRWVKRTIPGQPASYRAIIPESARATVEYMYQYLNQEIMRLADEAYRQEVQECRASMVAPPSARAWKGSFRVGCAYKIAVRLKAQRKKTLGKAVEANKTTALMRISKTELAVKAEIKKLKLRSGPAPTAGHTSTSGYKAGQAAGGKVSLGGGTALGAGKGQLRG